MAMLPAPIIEGTLPAFYGNTLTVPFMMSRAVSSDEIQGFQLKMKSVYQSTIIINPMTTTYDLANGTVTFGELDTSKLQAGNFYKVQIAYMPKDGSGATGGFYSTVGVAKYTTRPEVTILKLADSNNAHMYNYTGVYSQANGDTSEKEYSYRFMIKDGDNNIIKDTGFLIHNTSNNVNPYESQDEFYYPNDLETNKRYTIQYTVRTNNGLEVSSPAYRLTSKKTAITSLNISVNAVNDYSNGYIQISFKGELDENKNETSAIGSFKILKASEKYDFADWKEIFNFNLINQVPSTISWKDYTIEQGVIYKYAIQQYNNKGIYSDKIESNKVQADFEDSFLFDGERQLKIKFNPKVSSFKHTLLESKLDTLGSKYPFIFRNGNVGYKEFPINGLLSYHMDDQGDFFDNKKIYDYDYRSSTGKLEPLKTYPDETTFLNNIHVYYIKIKVADNSNEYKFQKLTVLRESTADLMVLYKNGWIKEQWENSLIYVDVNKEWATNNDFAYASTNLDSMNYQIERDFKLEVLDWLNNGKPKLFRSPAEGNYIVRLMNISLTPNDTLGRMLHTFQATAYEVAENTYENWVENNFIKTTANSVGGDNSYFKIIYSDLSAGNDRIKLGTNPRNYVYFKLQDFEPGSTMRIRFVGESGSIWDDSKLYIIGSTGTYVAPIPVSEIRIPDATLEKKKGIIIAGYYDNLENENYFEGISDIQYDEVVSKQVVGQNKNIISEIELINTNIKTSSGETKKGDIKISNFNKIRIYRRPFIQQESERYYPLQTTELHPECFVKIDGIELKLADNVNYLEYKDFDTVPKSLIISSGVYVELFYQYQVLIK